MIEVKNIYQSYGKNKVLKNVNLMIEEEKITALVGANGAGKSTLLGVISRLIMQESGDVLIDGSNIRHMKNDEIARQVAVLKQTNHLSIRISIYDLVSFGRYPHSKGRLKLDDYQKIDQAIHYMDLEDIKDKYLDELSGGQRQRAFIAMILAQDTKYVLLDEPLNNLDMRYAVEMMLILSKLVKELKKTIVIVVHDINIAASFADQIIAMKDGEIYQTGDAHDMIDTKVLNPVFDHDFCIASFNGKKICVYHPEHQINKTGE